MDFSSTRNDGVFFSVAITMPLLATLPGYTFQADGRDAVADSRESVLDLAQLARGRECGQRECVAI